MANNGNQPNCDTLLSPAQVAQICGFSRRAVYDAIGRGDLKAFRLCARLRISSGNSLTGCAGAPSPNLTPANAR